MGLRWLIPPLSISHMLFSDDSLIFIGTNHDEAHNIKHVLFLYEKDDGQRINFQKSAIAFGPNVDKVMQNEISSFLGIPIVGCHEKYLGLPTVAGRNKREMFRNISDRLSANLQGWQGKLLSKAGKAI